MSMPYQSLADQLVPFETFDRNAFIEDAQVPQRVCDLVLSLAQAFDDFRDVFFARELVSEVPSPPNGVRTVSLGLRNGLQNVLIRVQTGFIHELLNLIRDSGPTISDPAFQRVLRQLSKEGKLAWKAIYDVGTNKPSNDRIAQALLFIRNKVAFHYDAKQLGRGYKSAFFELGIHGDPLISRGSKMYQTRFYFADASSEAYIFSQAKEDRIREFLVGEGELLYSINQALYEVVTRFIQMRSAWMQAKTHG